MLDMLVLNFYFLLYFNEIFVFIEFSNHAMGTGLFIFLFNAADINYNYLFVIIPKFLDHDVTFTPSYLTQNGHLLDCKACDSRETVHPECRPISIPANDPFFNQMPNLSGKPRCLHFVRSMNAQVCPTSI